MGLKDDLKKLKERLDKNPPKSKEQPKQQCCHATLNQTTGKSQYLCPLPAGHDGPHQTPQPIQTEPPKEDKPPKTEVVYRCGHVQPVGDLKNHDCRACQKKTFVEKSGIVPRGTRGKGKGRSNVARLPKGSSYCLDYHEEGERKWWVGTLLLPNPTEQGALALTFTGEADSVHYLLDLLGKKWRDWEREEAARRADSDTVIPPECSA